MVRGHGATIRGACGFYGAYRRTRRMTPQAAHAKRNGAFTPDNTADAWHWLRRVSQPADSLGVSLIG